ncbi:MAG: tetratricopeptide repeat protein [Bacteroidota bacterium]
MSEIDRIYELIEKKEFQEAENTLAELGKQGLRSSVVNYFLGIIYSEYDNKEKSIQKAKEFFQYAIDGEQPIEDAFLRLSTLETIRPHSIRILRKGLEIFPKSTELYEKLLLLNKVSEREQIYSEVVAKGITSSTLDSIMLCTFAELSKYDDGLKLAPKVTPSDHFSMLLKRAIEGFCYLETNNVGVATARFEELLGEDISRDLKYAPHVGLVLCYIQDKKEDRALDIFSEVPLESEVEGYLLTPPLWFDFGDYFLKALSHIERFTKDREVIGKVRGLRGLHLYGYAPASQKMSRYRSDLEYANRVYPRNRKFCEYLANISLQQNQLYTAYKSNLQLLKNLSEDEHRQEYDYIDCDFISQMDENDFQRVLTDFRGLVSERNYQWRGFIYSILLNPIVEKLFKKKDYKGIVELADSLSDQDLRQSNVLFEIAYAYSEVGNRAHSKKCYEMHVEKRGITSSVANNLGVLYQRNGDLQKAEEFFTKSIGLDPEDDLPKRNLEEVKALRDAALRFTNESFESKRTMLLLSKNKNIDGYIVGSDKEVSDRISKEERECRALMGEFMQKKYLSRVTDYKSHTNKPTYKINPDIEKQLSVLEQDLQRETEFVEIAKNITAEALERIGYDDELTSSLTKILSHELQAMLKRDLKENALALATKSYKASLVISGSMIEALLLDRISSRKVTSYRMASGRNKKVAEMDLGELLEVAKKEKIIADQLYHLAHALRGFRNLIHPGVEYRKKAMPVTEQNARIAWDITRKIILEL